MPTPARKTTAAPTATAPKPTFTVVAKPSAAPAPKKKLDLSGLNKKPASKGGKSYPLFTPPLEGEEAAEFRALVSTLLAEKKEFKQLEGTIGTHTAAVLALVRPELHRLANGRADNSQACLVNGEGDDVALVNMIKKYKFVTDDTAIRAALGAELYEEFFEERSGLKLDLQKVPEEVRQDFVNEIVALAQRMNCTGAVEAKEGVGPKPHFHTLRRSRLTVEENIALDELIPLEIHIKSKDGENSGD